MKTSHVKFLIKRSPQEIHQGQFYQSETRKYSNTAFMDIDKTVKCITRECEKSGYHSHKVGAIR